MSSFLGTADTADPQTAIRRKLERIATPSEK
jgi:hypothetical protein